MDVFTHKYYNYIVQVATPFAVGTGLLLPQYGLIVTNEHIVRDAASVVISSLVFECQVADVVYLNARSNLAFLSAPNVVLDELNISRSATTPPMKNRKVIAIGYPVGKGIVVQQGTVLDNRKDEYIGEIISHNAILSCDCSGGPLIDNMGAIAAINTFIDQSDGSVGWGIPFNLVFDEIEKFRKKEEKEAVVCVKCGVMKTNIETVKKCSDCKNEFLLPSNIPPFKPQGVAATIEQLITQNNHEVELSRRGNHNWEILQGSANINISYYEKKGIITGDAYLCKLPTDKEKQRFLLSYILKQNYQLNELKFSVQGQNVVLSLLIFDRYLNESTGKALFGKLFKKADDFDNILVEQYGGIWQT